MGSGPSGNPPLHTNILYCMLLMCLQMVNKRSLSTVSTDSKYEMPPDKHTVSFPCCFVTEMEMCILDRLKPTATGSMGSQHGF